MWSGRIKAEQVHVARVAQRPRPGGAVTTSGVAGVVRGVSAPEGRSRSAGRNDPRVVEASTLDRPTEDRARDELYEKLHSELQRPARAMVRRAFGAKFSDAEIEDIYANAWVGTLRALRNRPGLSEPELRKYVLTAVANHASKELRRRGRRPTSPLDSAPEVVDRQATPDERVAIREQAQITREILATLPERRRAVLMFRYAWGLKPEEVCGLVDGLSHRAYRNDTVEQVRAPAGPTEMVYKVEASSSIVGAAQEPFAIASAQPLTPLANPEVDPVNSREDASGTVNCQTDVVVSTELENESPDLDANSAGVTLNLPAGVSLVSGPASQPVSGGVLERSTPSSETHTWTVRATSSGAKQLTITGSGGTMGETFTSSDQVAFEADCSPPTVTPTGTAVSPLGPAPCGTDQVISTTLRNSSATDAQSAQVVLELPAGVELISSSATQQVSDGVLERETTSEQHSWTVRPTQPNLSATVSGSGSDGSQTFAYPQVVSIGCQSDGPGGGGPGNEAEPVTLEIDKARMKSGRLVVKGTATSFAGPPPGQVRVEIGGERHKVKTTSLDDGRFKAKVRICDPGRFSVRASYPGAAGFATAQAAARQLRVRERQLRC